MRPRAAALPIAAAFVALVSGCEGGGGPAGVVVDGSSTVFRISRAAQTGYDAVAPDVTVVVDNHGTGGGFGRYLQGEVDIVDASRAAKPDEEEQARVLGFDWTRFVVGYDGITVVVHRSNDFVESLDVGQLRAIWEPGSAVRTWKDIDPSWPDRGIVLYSPDRDSGTYEFFTDAIVGKGKGEREDVQASSDDNTLVNGVAGDPDALGYFGFAYYQANASRLRALAIRKGPGAPAVLPSPATVMDKTYAPLSRPLYLYVKNAALRRPEVAGFVTYYLENIETLAPRADYVAPSAEERAANLAALAKVLGGRASTAAKAG